MVISFFFSFSVFLSFFFILFFFLMPLSVSFLGNRSWCCSVDEACAHWLIQWRLLPNDCSVCISQKALESVARRGLLIACRNCPSPFSFDFLEFSGTEEVESPNLLITHNEYSEIFEIYT